MRTLWVSIITVALLAGSAIGVAGQIELEPGFAIEATGTIIDETDIEEAEVILVDSAWQGRGGTTMQTTEWSDPTLPSAALVASNWNEYRVVGTAARPYVFW